MSWYISLRLSKEQTAQLQAADDRLHKSPHLTLFFSDDDNLKHIGETWVQRYKNERIHAKTESLIALGFEKPVIALKLSSPEGSRWYQEILDAGVSAQHHPWLPHLTMIYGVGETEQKIAQTALNELPKGTTLFFDPPKIRVFKPRTPKF